MGAPSASVLTVTTFGLGATFESWGSMGIQGFDFDWVRVSAANNAQPCSAATSPCIEELVFGNFSDGFAGTINVASTVKTPTASDPLGASTTKYGCAGNPAADQYGFSSFILPIDVTNAHGVAASSAVGGTYARGVVQ